jgi:hypothetical protein
LPVYEIFLGSRSRSCLSLRDPGLHHRFDLGKLNPEAQLAHQFIENCIGRANIRRRTADNREEDRDETNDSYTIHDHKPPEWGYRTNATRSPTGGAQAPARLAGRIGD